MIKVIVSTHQGRLYEESCDYIVIKTQNGEFGILTDHIPICTAVTIGYVKLVTKDENYFLSLVNGLIEFKENVCNVVAQEAHIGRSHEAAMDNLNAIRADRMNFNRKTNFDYTKNERDIRENLKNVKAGNL